jgi:hypothetical protein
MRRVTVLTAVVAILLTAVGVGATAVVGSQRVTNPTATLTIEQLMYTYGYQLDSGTVAGLGTVFADDAHAFYTFPGGTFDLDGKQAILDFLGPFTGDGGAHQLTNPVVDVQGNQATGTFYLWRVQPAEASCADEGSGPVGWILGRYDMEFSKIRGDWYIQDLHFVTESTGTLTGCDFGA